MKPVVKTAFIATIPVLTGYLVLGFGFGILLSAAGYGVIWAVAIALTMYSGSMQYMAVSLLSTGASMLTVAVTTLMVQARHLFYGISMIDKYRGIGKIKPYLMFAMTDETYSLVCTEPPEGAKANLKLYYFSVSIMNHCYWITGCVLGSLVGTLFPFRSDGIDFVLTALFLTIFTEQWLSNPDHRPALIGLGSSVLCLAIFGAESFLIPTMLVIASLLLLIRKPKKKEENA